MICARKEHNEFFCSHIFIYLAKQTRHLLTYFNVVLMRKRFGLFIFGIQSDYKSLREDFLNIGIWKIEGVEASLASCCSTTFCCLWLR